MPGEPSVGRHIHYQDYLALVLRQADVPALQDISHGEVVDALVRLEGSETGATGQPRAQHWRPQKYGTR